MPSLTKVIFPNWGRVLGIFAWLSLLAAFVIGQIAAEKDLRRVPVVTKQLEQQQRLMIQALNRFLLAPNANPVPVLDREDDE